MRTDLGALAYERLQSAQALENNTSAKPENEGKDTVMDGVEKEKLPDKEKPVKPEALPSPASISFMLTQLSSLTEELEWTQKHILYSTTVAWTEFYNQLVQHYGPLQTFYNKHKHL